MAVSIDWDTRIIFVPKADMTQVQTSPFEIRKLDLDWLRMQLKAIEASEDGMPMPDTHKHATEVLLGSVTLARVIEFINNYTVTFEDGQYAVDLEGANSNLADVLNLNTVQVRSYNSAGLTTPAAPSDIAESVWSYEK